MTAEARIAGLLADGLGIEGRALVPVCYPEIFCEVEKMSPFRQRELRTKMLSLRIVAGLETGSLRQIAKRHGVNFPALAAACRLIASRIGIHWALKSAEARRHYSELARERWRKRKNPPAATPAGLEKQEPKNQT